MKPDPQMRDGRRSLQQAMNLLAAFASGMEDALGETANSITYLAGKKLGHRFSANAARTEDPRAALAEVSRVLRENNCLWGFETFKPKAQPDAIRIAEDGEEILLVFRDCMIRQSLFRFGHVQRGSLCTMMYGFFVGALERIMNREAELEILHAGENACLKKLHLRRAAEPAHREIHIREIAETETQPGVA